MYHKFPNKGLRQSMGAPAFQRYRQPTFCSVWEYYTCWKALELNLKNIKTGDGPLLEVRPYWGIYGINCRKLGAVHERWKFQVNPGRL